MIKTRSTRSNRPKAHRGFAAMSPDLQRKIASRGGRVSAKTRKRDKRGRFR